VQKNTNKITAALIPFSLILLLIIIVVIVLFGDTNLLSFASPYTSIPLI